MKWRPTGSAHSGLGEWLLQRLSALYMAGFTLFAIGMLCVAPPPDYVMWSAWFGHGWVRMTVALFYLSALVHAWIGMRSIFMDYLKPLWLRFAATALLGIGMLAMVLWTGDVLLWRPV